MRLLEITAGSQTFAVPLSDVQGVAVPARDEPTASLADRLGLAGAGASHRVVLRTRSVSGRQYHWEVDDARSTHELPVLPLPAMLGPAGAGLPFRGLALLPSGPALVLDGDALAGEQPSGAHAMPAPPQAPLVPGPAAPGTTQPPPGGHPAQPGCARNPPAAPGEPLLICSLGPYRLRGRPLAIGVPLAAVSAVRRAQELVPLPLAPDPLQAVVASPEGFIPVFCAASALALPRPASAGTQLVMLRSNIGPAALRVDRALSIDRPRHWAPPSLLLPIESNAIAGVVPRRDRWVAVLEPGLVAPTPAGGSSPGGGALTGGEAAPARADGPAGARGAEASQAAASSAA
jgi:chemotaxis signal transduction protein